MLAVNIIANLSLQIMAGLGHWKVYIDYGNIQLLNQQACYSYSAMRVCEVVLWCCACEVFFHRHSTIALLHRHSTIALLRRHCNNSTAK